MTSMRPSSNDRLSQDALPLASPSGGKASVASCIINLASTCMGTGILALPSAYHLGGFASGTLLCIASAGLCSLSLKLLLSSGEKVKAPATFATVCEAALPNSGLLIDFAVIINCVGCAASYLIVAADCFSALGFPRKTCVLVAILAVSPASLFRNLDTLKASSSVAICCLIGIVLMVVVMGVVPTGSAFDPCPGVSAKVGPHGHCGGPVTWGSTVCRSRCVCVCVCADCGSPAGTRDDTGSTVLKQHQPLHCRDAACAHGTKAAGPDSLAHPCARGGRASSRDRRDQPSSPEVSGDQPSCLR